MWQGHLDCYSDKLEDITKSPDDSDVGYFVEVDSKYPNVKKQNHQLSIFSSEET